MSSTTLAYMLNSTIIFMVPLLLVALGGMFSERSGIINIALEGIMVVGALFACLFLNVSDAAGWGQLHPQLTMLAAVLVAGICGMLLSLLLAFAAISLKADQTIGGVALNIFAPAFAVIIAWAYQGNGITTINIPTWIRIGKITKESGFFECVLFKSCYLTTPIAILLVLAAIFVLYKTRFGLRLRACGEHPQAADAVGVNVYKMRYSGTVISGFLGGVGGLSYAIAAGSGFSGSVNGWGFLALAVMIFGNWQPVRIVGAALFFALFKVVSSYYGSIPFLPDFSFISYSSYIYQATPYVLTMVVLIFTSKRSRAPKAEGIPYDKGGR